MKKSAGVGALVGAMALVLAACGEAPSDSEETAANSDFEACMVTDEGGVDDKSFNATAWKGIQDAEDELGIKGSYLESSSEADYAPNVAEQVSADCGIIVTVGYALAADTGEAAVKNPDEKLAIVDYGYTLPDEQKYRDAENLKPLVFNTAEAAYLAGYAAAGMTETGKVATWGGAPYPTVTIFMDGFWQGVQDYNKDNGEDVAVLGWNQDTQKGSFVGDFSDVNKAKVISENFIQQGADIIMPVAGPLGESAVTAAKGTDGVSVVWVDTDGCETLGEEACPYILTSVEKAMDVAVTEAVKSATNDSFSNEKYIGTLENDGVSISDFHEFDSKVPQDLKDKLDELKQQIIDGELEITSPAQQQL